MRFKREHLLDYIINLKNLRGILLYNPEKGVCKEKLKWISKVHRYRSVGVPESVCKDDAFLKPPFVRLTFPFTEAEDFFKGSSPLPFYLVEALALSSCHVSPLFIMDEEIFQALSPLILWALRKGEVDAKEILRHIRISLYAQIDFLLSAKEEFRMLKKGEKDLIIKRREKIAAEDGKKRFWRLKEDGGKVLVAYFDLLRLFDTSTLKRKDPIYSIFFSICCGFRI